MLILPAIDLRGGRCVRLVQGRKEQETVYDDDPVHAACRWADQGASFLHVVDLDGAFTGGSQNLDVVERILRTVPVPIQLGGGIRSLDAIERVLASGVARVIIGTAAVTDPGLVAAAIDRWGAGRVVVGIDARDGQVAVRGWEEGAPLSAIEAARRVKRMGVERVVYTDIVRDGMLTGPNVEATRRLAVESGLRVIASGGVSSMDDLSRLAALGDDGIEGVIIGKALYEGTIDLKEAIERFGEKQGSGVRGQGSG
ncbi:MAG: 1-(5-phosphoribosyl)-5-[(5-phosphoribosylamino)methylideneamino]imidazole-4-carboxamide isomerase, partial [Candidatus Latescibacteria bacterium]|nr:1-(5-phosphoribosyl)-5-[(5-phosphoribosylamino)methylideneamino]imidazole-4-carboxamide isomerase [Candidatus Latescibacterota bacterium]